MALCWGFVAAAAWRTDLCRGLWQVPGVDDQGVVMRPDQVTLGVLVTAVPRDAVDAAVAACGVGDRRGGGKLPGEM